RRMQLLLATSRYWHCAQWILGRLSGPPARLGFCDATPLHRGVSAHPDQCPRGSKSQYYEAQNASLTVVPIWSDSPCKSTRQIRFLRFRIVSACRQKDLFMVTGPSDLVQLVS